MLNSKNIHSNITEILQKKTPAVSEKQIFFPIYLVQKGKKCSTHFIDFFLPIDKQSLIELIPSFCFLKIVKL